MRGMVRALRRKVTTSPHLRHFFMNLMIGLVIEVVIHFMTGGMFVTHVRNAVQDATMNVAARIPGRVTRSDPAIAVFDVDDETWRDPSWGGGEADIAPRAQVARLVDIAVRAGARYVVVDIVVENPGRPDDAQFVAAMGEIGKRMRADQHVLFVRSLRAPLCAGDACPEGESAPTVRTSPLDALVGGSGGRFVRVAPNFLVSPDGVLRGWVLWKPACVTAPGSGAGTWQALPSVQLAVRELERVREHGGAPVWAGGKGFGACMPTLAGAQEAADGAVHPVSLAHAEGAMAEAMAPALGASHAGSHEGDDAQATGRHDPASVIFFRNASGTGPVAAGGNGIQTLSVRTLLGGRDPGSLAGQVVIIAQSHEVARDHHLTPLGRMPGAMVLANAINSMRAPGVLAHAPGALEYGFALVMIVLAAWLFAVVRAEFALLLAFGFVPVVLLVSYLSLRSGLQLGAEIAILGIYLHWLFQTIETALVAGRAHGHGKHHADEHTLSGTTQEQTQ